MKGLSQVPGVWEVLRDFTCSLYKNPRRFDVLWERREGSAQTCQGDPGIKAFKTGHE